MVADHSASAQARHGKSLESTDLEQQLRYELINIRMAFSSEDAKEARKAFFEKRKPVFKGR